MVELPQVGFTIHVEAFDSSFAGHPYRSRHQLPPDASTLILWVNRGIQKEGMAATIPGYVDKPDQAFVSVSTDEGKAAAKYRLEPRRGVVRPCCIEQGIHLCVRHSGTHNKADVGLRLWYSHLLYVTYEARPPHGIQGIGRRPNRYGAATPFTCGPGAHLCPRAA
jgi:hypothetical protein